MTRLERHRVISAALAAIDDRALARLLEGRPFRASIGGGTTTIEIAGTPVFVKRVALTDLEAAHPRSTRNLFELPLVYQYRLGSSGFSAWRELVAHELTTSWVVDGICAGFPLLHHARVLPTPPPQPVDELGTPWASPAIRARLEAIARATASIVLFLEHLPRTVHDWYAAQADPAEACAMIERETGPIVDVLRARGMLHMDAHWGNLLTDGQRIYATDFGLAISRSFELSSEERAFFERHARYDEHVLRRELVSWNPSADVLARHGAVARTLGEFYQRLRVDLTTRYPDEL